MDNMEPKVLPSIEPPIDEVSSYGSNIALNEAQVNALSKRNAKFSNSKRRKE